MARNYKEYNPLTSISVTTKDGDKLVNYSSTQYLGITWKSEFKQKIKKLKLKSYDFGSIGSNFLGGTHPLRTKLEKKTASLLKYERALCFSSGWSANFSICEYISKHFDIVISDTKNHNSIITGLRNTSVKKIVLDLNSSDLTNVISEYTNSKIVIIYTTIEGITGVKTNLNFSNKNDVKKVTIISDECHSFGMIGNTGFELFDSIKPDIRMVSFSKSIGIMGAAVVAKNEIIEEFSQISSPWIYSTAVPPLIWKAILISLKIVKKSDTDRIEIMDKALYFRSKLNSLNIYHIGNSHITGVIFSKSINPIEVEKQIQKFGILVKISGPPSTKGEYISRIAFQPGHNYNHIDNLILTLSKIITKY